MGKAHIKLAIIIIIIIIAKYMDKTIFFYWSLSVDLCRIK